MSGLAYTLLDKGLIPYFILRMAIRYLCKKRLREIDRGSFQDDHEAKMQWIESVKTRADIADVPEKANEQHYEVNTEYWLATLGPLAKYSCSLFPTGNETLEEAVRLMIERYCVKAQVGDNMDILDLGCGWGAVPFYLSEEYPNARITGLSNSATQKEYIDKVAAEKGIRNITNYEALFKKVASWLRPTPPPHPFGFEPKSDNGDTTSNDNTHTNNQSLLFIHILCHHKTPYHFVEDDGWMAQSFFTGGTMPSFDLFSYFQRDLTLCRSWYLSGTNYSRTAEHWLKNQDKNRDVCLKALRDGMVARGKPASEGDVWFNRFRVYHLTTAEFFKLDKGQQWGIGHYVFKRSH